MNFIGLRDLEQRLRTNTVSEKESYLYLLANWLFFGMMAMGTVDDQHDNPGVMLVLLVLPAVGLTTGYFANKRGDGKDFLRRFIAIHWVLGIRFFVFIFATVAFNQFILRSLLIPELRNWIPPFLVMGVIVGFYLSVRSSMARISGAKGK